MKRIMPLLYIMLHLSSCDGAIRSKRSRCGAESLDDFSHVIAGSGPEINRCKECEAAMVAYRCKGFEYVFGEFKKMCTNWRGRRSPKSCLGALEMYKDEVHQMLWDLKVPDSEACRFVLGCGAYNNSIYNWKFDIPTDPYPTEPNGENVKPIELEPFSVLLLTDTHISTEYAVGSSPDCLDELCCTDRQLENGTPVTSAGPYGDISGTSNCDLPMRTLKNLLANARARNFSYVYLTGDFVPHTTSNYTFARVIEEIREQTKIISDGLAGHRIFPSIGNHDDYPAFQFPTHKMQAGKYSIDKLYNALWKIWGGTWIPEDAEKTFKKGGYYTVLVQPGLRIFSMNTVYCYKMNWWLAVNPKDPEDQLEWLVSGLEAAAKNGEKVHLLGHVPPGTAECKREWALAYQKIVARFRNVITGQFFGHMHWDMFSVDFAPGTDEPTGVQFTAPSATTYMTGYPSYRIMHFGSNTEPLDMDTYLLNITRLNSPFMERANKTDEAGLGKLLDELEVDDPARKEWQLAYSHKSQYGIPDLSPTTIAGLIDRMREDGKLLGRYYRAYFQHRHEPCEMNCRDGSCKAVFYYEAGTWHSVICELYSAGTKQRIECRDAMNKNASRRINKS